MARVLVVDDSAVARKALSEILNQLGHRVAGEATSGSQAFVEYVKLKPDLVTMDLTMPGMSGIEATAKIIATFPAARIIVISAMEGRQVVLEALEKGARHFIIKPITTDKVTAVVNGVLQQEFDRDKHLELIKKLKGAEEFRQASLVPPFSIESNGQVVMIKVNPNISANSCQSLTLELEEHLAAGSARVLIDFGNMTSLEKALIGSFDALIGVIEQKGGVVKAVSRNQDFSQALLSESGGNCQLAAVLHTLAK